MTELHAIPVRLKSSKIDSVILKVPQHQSEMPAGGSYEISEMPSYQPPVELGVTSQTKSEVIYQQTKVSSTKSQSNDSISKVVCPVSSFLCN